MFRFLRKQPSIPPLEQAMELLRRGQTVQAEEVMLKATRTAEQRFGVTSYEHADAQNDLGMVLLHLGQAKRAVDAFQDACAGPLPLDREQRKSRLSFMLNLAQAQEEIGNTQEAEQVLRQALEGRRDFYGREHPGYAFGLEPLAALLMKQGRTAEARLLMEEVADIFRKSGHPRAAGALVLLAEARQAGGATNTPPAFAELTSMPFPLIEQVAAAAVGRMGDADPLVLRSVLADLVEPLAARLGEDHQAVLNVLATRVNLEQSLGAQGDPVIRQEAARHILAIHERLGKETEVAQDLMGLALALSDAGDLDGAADCYRDAAARAARQKDNRLLSQVRRNFGLYLAEQEQREEAETELRAAVEAVPASRLAEDREMRGRALVALGIFLQHGERLDEARPHLEEAMQLLEPAHPDAIVGRSHLGAIVNGGSCGCGDTGKALADAFRAFVLPRLPDDLLEKLDVGFDDEGGLSLSVSLRRTPTDGEVEHMNRVFQHALAEFKKRLTEGSPYG